MEFVSDVWLFFGVINALMLLYAITVLNGRSNLRAILQGDILRILSGMAIWAIMLLLGFVGGPFWTFVAAITMRKFIAMRRNKSGGTVINQ